MVVLIHQTIGAKTKGSCFEPPYGGSIGFLLNVDTRASVMFLWRIFDVFTFQDH